MGDGWWVTSCGRPVGCGLSLCCEATPAAPCSLRESGCDGMARFSSCTLGFFTIYLYLFSLLNLPGEI